MKNPLSLEIIFFILTCLFVFFIFPFISLAQFTPTNPPCEPEVIPAFGQTSATFCPYCPNKGDYLHLKWDLQADFTNPVCSISCWAPTGDSCSNWPTNRLFNSQGQIKTNFKPKDDVFVKKPTPNSSRTGPGTNLQVSCFEKNNPSKTKASTGIRVMGECGESVACVERSFKDIIADLDNYRPTVITEKNLRDWSGRYDTLDSSQRGGSGNVADVMNAVVARQCSSSNIVSNDLNSFEDLHLELLDLFKKATKNGDATPLSFILFNRVPTSPELIQKIIQEMSVEEKFIFRQSGFLTEDNKLMVKGGISGYHAIIFLGIEGHNADYSSIDIKILDPNYAIQSSGQFPTNIKILNCKREMWQARFVSSNNPALVRFWDVMERVYGFRSALADSNSMFSIILNEPGVFRPIFVCPYEMPNRASEGGRGVITVEVVPYVDGRYVDSVYGPVTSLDRLKANAVRSETSKYLQNPDNILAFGNFSIPDGSRADGGVCAGWSDFVLRTAYLGKFQDIDCHPDGTLSKDQESQNFLAQFMKSFKNLTASIGFLRFDKNL